MHWQPIPRACARLYVGWWHFAGERAGVLLDYAQKPQPRSLGMIS